MGVIEDWLECYNARDWDRLVGFFSPTDFLRVGPFGDTISSSTDYVGFLRRVIPTLGSQYGLTAERIVYAERTVTAELVEHYELHGELRHTPEVIVFDLDGEGRITSVHVYVQRVGEVAAAGGRAAMGDVAEGNDGA